MFFIGIHLYSYSQSYLFNIQQYSVEDGISGRYTYDVQEDGRGFIWVSSWLGLDGFEFKQFPREKYGFKHEGYNSLLLDRNGKIWMVRLTNNQHKDEEVNQQDINIFNPKIEKVETDSFFSDVPFNKNSVHSVKNDHENNIWIALINGEVYKYDGKNVELILRIKESFSSFYISPKNYLYAIPENTKEVLFYDFEKNLVDKVTFTSSIIQSQSTPDGGVLLTLCDFTNPNLIVEWNLISPNKPKRNLVFYKNDQPLTFYHKPNDFVNTFNFDQQGRLWISGYENILIFDKNYQYISDFKERKIEIQFGIRTFHFGKKGVLWGAGPDGITATSIDVNPFSNYLIGKNLVDTRAMAEDSEGNIYINQSNKTFRLNPQNGLVKNIGINGSRGALYAKNKKLYLGFYELNIKEYDPKTEKSISFSSDQVLSDLGASNVFYQSKKTETIYLGAIEGGLYIVDTEQKLIVPFSKTNGFDEFKKASIYHFYDHQDGIWISTNLGLFLLDEGKGIIKNYNLKKKEGIIKPNLFLHQEEAGDFWIGTLDDGLYKVNASMDSILVHLTTEDGLSDNTIYAIYEDKFGYLWLPSNNGLMRMNKNNYKLKTFLPGDGILHPEFNTSSHLRGSDGRFYFGGLKGLTSFSPKDFQSNNSKNDSPLQISQIEILNQQTGDWIDKTIEYHEKNSISLKPNNKLVKIKFIGMDLVNSDRNQFSYRKKGDQEWTLLEKNTLEFQSIPYGESQFEVRGRVKNSDWTVGSSPIIFNKTRPLFMQLPFIIGIGLLVILFIYFLRNRSIKRKKQRTEKIKAAIETIKESMAPVIPDTAIQNPSLDSSEIVPPTSASDQWLKILRKNATLLINDGKFSIIELAATMNLSERQFRRKLQQKIDISPATYMREIRLQKAMELLKKQEYQTVAEVSFAVGFSTPKHFSRLFKERFGKKPSSLLEKGKPN